MVLRAVHVPLGKATGVHHGKVGAHTVTDGFIRATSRVFEQLSRQQYAGRYRGAPPVGAFGETLGNAAVGRGDECRPGKRLRPLADGMRLRHKVGDLEAWAAAGQLMLQVTEQTHRQLSSSRGTGSPGYDDTFHITIPSNGANTLVATR
jgi:hypothetical protein